MHEFELWKEERGARGGQKDRPTVSSIRSAAHRSRDYAELLGLPGTCHKDHILRIKCHAWRQETTVTFLRDVRFCVWIVASSIHPAACGSFVKLHGCWPA